jgi:predicted SAM-dependent methyltransferase
VKLNLGCGNDIKSGYVNVDFRKTHPEVVLADLSVFPWPFEDGSAEEILMLDFLEHFPYAQTNQILLECYRVLAPGGQVVIQVPDAGHLTRAIGMIGEYLCNRCGGKMGGYTNNVIECGSCKQTAEEIADAAMRRLYGGQDYPGNFHQTCFTKEMLERRAIGCGFQLLEYEEKEHQYKNWNFKARFEKGDIW